MYSLDELDRLAAEKGLKRIPGLSPYAADRDGNIWNLANKWRSIGPRRLHALLDMYGYLSVKLRIRGKYVAKKVHALVCLAFNGERPRGYNETRHLNGIRHDNRPENLSWGTTRDNYLDRVKHGNDFLKKGTFDPSRACLKVKGVHIDD